MPPGSEFCSDDCAEMFAAWSERQLDWDAAHDLVTEPDPPSEPTSGDRADDETDG